jgi:lysophospholipase L1-like esterase
VLADGASVGPVTSYRFDGVTAGHTIGATFALDTRTITASAEANGSIEPPGLVAVDYGGSRTFAIVPAAHHHVADVRVDGASVGPVTSYTFDDVTASHTIGATFALDTRTITASAGANGSITPAGGVAVPFGESQTFAIAPAAHYHVADVLVDGASVGPVTTYTFNGVTAGHSIGATFALDTRTITASAGANGNITPAGGVAVPYGGSQTFAITPAAGYHVAEVLVDGASVGATTSYTFSKVAADHTISATFSNTWRITVTEEGEGSVTPSGTVTVVDGGSRTFSIEPAAHHHVDDVVVDGDSVGATTGYTFSDVSEDHTIRVRFAIDVRVVAASADGQGGVEPFGLVEVDYDGSRTFTLVPASGYHVASVLVDGAVVGAMTRYTFSNVTEDHTIVATFAEGPAPRAVFFGSSTVEGVGASDTAHRWTSLVAACFGWTEVNQGLSGSTMTMLDDSGTSAEARWRTAVVDQDPDIVFVQYGANDVTAEVALGEPGQPQTFRNATSVVLGGIAAALPSAPFYVVEPQPATALGGRAPYDAALAEFAAPLDLPVVHAGQAFPAGQYAADWIHLDDAGHSALAQFVATSIAASGSWSMPACTF